MLFAIPMCALYFVGVYAGLVMVLRREGRTFPWQRLALTVLTVAVVIGVIYFVLVYFHLHFIRHWPYLSK